MAKFNCTPFRSVEADSAEEAAEIFGRRAAFNAYGRKGFLMTKREDCWTSDKTCVHYEATIAYRSRPTGPAQGSRVQLYIYPMREVAP